MHSSRPPAHHRIDQAIPSHTQCKTGIHPQTCLAQLLQTLHHLVFPSTRKRLSNDLSHHDLEIFNCLGHHVTLLEVLMEISERICISNDPPRYALRVRKFRLGGCRRGWPGALGFGFDSNKSSPFDSDHVSESSTVTFFSSHWEHEFAYPCRGGTGCRAIS
jgi:hypothetical protein